MDPLSQTVRWARGADRILVLTGAGLSADSGLPTYRGVGGLYDGIDTADGLPIEEALSGHMMKRDPGLCWRYIAQIEQACRGAQFNAGHAALVELEKHAQVVVVTQNVDGFHRDAGSSKVIEVHGSLRRLFCMGCGRPEDTPDYATMAIPPVCEACGSIVRPDVVLFGEALPGDAMHAWNAEMHLGFDMVLSVGTSSGFPYIAEPVIWARRNGIPSVEINPGSSSVSRVVDLRWPERASVALPALVEALG
ncbi:MAG: NAD-dependent deacylase [Proteobacteria bacterium]|nr:NAD-dependent deacylase [Pseudomonadota bacterium]